MVILNCEEDDEEEPDNVEQIGQETQYKEVITKETTLKNIDSIMSKIEELKKLVRKQDIDIFRFRKRKSFSRY